MKNIMLSAISVFLVGIVSTINASETKLDVKNYVNITIEKSISTQEIEAYLKDAKDMGVEVIDNPTFGCLDIGYTKANLFEEGTLYGTKGKDGNVEVGQNGDFEVYSFLKYFKDGVYCVETIYTKGDRRYGNSSVASLIPKRK